MDDCSVATRVGLFDVMRVSRRTTSAVRVLVLAWATDPAGVVGRAGSTVTTILLADFFGAAPVTLVTLLGAAVSVGLGLPFDGIFGKRSQRMPWLARCLMRGSNPVSPEMIEKRLPGNSTASFPM